MIDTKKIALWQKSKALLLPSKANAFIATKRRPRLQIMGDDARSLVNTSKLRKPQLECWRCFASSGLQVDLQWTGWRLHAETEWTLVNLHKSKIGSSVSLRLSCIVTSFIRQTINKSEVILLCGFMRTILRVKKKITDVTMLLRFSLMAPWMWGFLNAPVWVKVLRWDPFGS